MLRIERCQRGSVWQEIFHSVPLSRSIFLSLRKINKIFLNVTNYALLKEEEKKLVINSIIKK